MKDENKYELIKFEDGEFSLDVNVSPDEDTVWLSQKDMSLLFDTDLSRISRHIKNIFTEMELDKESNLRKTQFPFSDKLVILYSLDVALAVGYRVKSKRGILFIRWANSVLKQYLLNEYVINEERCLACSINIISLQNNVETIETKIKGIEESIYLENSKAFYEGEIIEPYTFIRHILFFS